MSQLKAQDPELYASIAAEQERQRDGLELIASENYTSRAVMEAQGSVLTNKYAEGRVVGDVDRGLQVYGSRACVRFRKSVRT